MSKMASATAFSSRSLLSVSVVIIALLMSISSSDFFGKLREPLKT
jgi:hypothetical protein